MSSLCKKPGVRLPLNQRLIDKIESIREIQHQQAAKISYVGLQFILNNKKVPEGVLLVFLKEIHGGKFQEIDIKWNEQLKNDKILEDFFGIKRKAIQQQWITQNMSKKNIADQQERFRNYLGKVKNKQQVQERLKLLREELKILQNNINIAKKEEQALSFRAKYQKAKQQYVFLRNRNRRINTLSIQRQAVENPGLVNRDKMAQLSAIAEEKSQEKQKKRYLQTLKKYSDKIQKKQKLSAQSRINRLQFIFNCFAKKEYKEEMLFGQIQEAQKGISLQIFLKLIAYSSINQLLTLDQRVTIFKQCGKYSKKIVFTDFVAALNQLCRKNCEKLKIRFDAQMTDAFLDDFILKIEASKLKPEQRVIVTNQIKSKSLIESNDLSKYQFKLSVHSGKLQQNMKEQLFERKKVKKEYLKLIKEKSLTVDHRQGIFNRSRSIQAEDQYLNKQPLLGFKRRQLYELPEINQEKSQNYAVVPRRSSQNYATIFQNKKDRASKRKRYSTENSMTHGKDERSSLISQEAYTQNEFITSFNDNPTPSQSPIKSFDHKLRELIADQEDDPFLTSHLQKKNILLTNDIQSRRYKKIHF